MKKACPCHSGLEYRTCCGPFHAGAAAPTPEALMRSRYAAFALGLGEYLVDTQSPAPEPRDEAIRTLSRAKETQRFLGLRIVHARADEAQGEVLFLARIFEKGKDQSFAELSAFQRHEGRWFYVDGTLLPTALLPADRERLTLEEFRELTSP